MVKWKMKLLFALLTGLLVSCTGSSDMSNSGMTSTGKLPGETQNASANTARDPQRAVEEEFAAAEQKNTAAAWQLFLDRHPDNALSAEAQRRLALLK
jgi:hypothetical protein